MDTQPTPSHNQPAMTSPTNTMNTNTSQPGNTPQPPQFAGNKLLANKKLLYGLIAGAVGIVLVIIIIIVVAIQSAPPSRKDLQDAQALIRSHSRTEDRLLQPLSRGETIDTKAFADNRKELISKLGSSRAVHDEDIKRAYEQYKHETDEAVTALGKLPSYYSTVATFIKECADTSTLNRQILNFDFRKGGSAALTSAPALTDSEIEKEASKTYGSCIEQAKKMQNISENDNARKLGTEYVTYYQKVKDHRLKAAQYYRTHSDLTSRSKYSGQNTAPKMPDNRDSKAETYVIDDGVLHEKDGSLTEMNKLLNTKMAVYRAA